MSHKLHKIKKINDPNEQTRITYHLVSEYHHPARLTKEVSPPVSKIVYISETGWAWRSIINFEDGQPSKYNLKTTSQEMQS